jgi:signal transduction histidine kinase
VVTEVKYMQSHHLGYVVKLALLAVVYFVTASIGLSLDAVSGFAALVWPPTGIALAAMLILGQRYWPAIAVAAFLVNAVTGAPPLVALGMAFGNTLEALLGAHLLKRIKGFQNSLERVNDVLGLVFFAAFLSTVVSATIGVSSLLLGGVIPASAYIATWSAWWVGDMLGALVFTPFLLVWSSAAHNRPSRFAEGLLLGVLLLGAAIFAFQGLPLVDIEPLSFVFVIFPFLILIALRFGQRGSVSAMLLLLLIATWSTTKGSGPFAGEHLSESLFLLQSFMGITAATFMVMAAAVSERERTVRHEHELMAQAALLTKQRSRLMAINRVKDEFIYVASHQLRTPATVVKQYIGMLLENYAGNLTKPQRRLLRYAYENNERQIQVINDLLGVAQIDAGNVVLKKERVDIAALVKEVIRGQGSGFASRKHPFALTISGSDLTVYVDKKKIQMALENIIDNASKYSLPGKKIEITVGEREDKLAISIKDEGIGMTKKDVRRLFKKFSRINNSLSVAVGGTGLGLYWAKKIIDLHGGVILVTSKTKHGSTFTIILPRSAESED